MSRFSPCRGTSLKEACTECSCNCADRLFFAMPCSEIASTIVDPGFEGISDKGPAGDEFPEIDFAGSPPAGIVAGTMYWPSNITAAPASLKWCQFEPASDLSNRFKVSTAGPRSGSTHARWTKPASIVVQPGYMMPVGFTLCKVDQFGPAARPFTAVVNPGDFITGSIYFKHTGGTGAEDSVHIECFSAYPALSSLGSSQSALTNIGATYTQLSHSMIAPSGSKYVRVRFQPRWLGTSGSSVDIDLDDGLVEIV